MRTIKYLAALLLAVAAAIGTAMLAVIEGTKGPLEGSGAPSNGTTETQVVTVTGSPNAGTFKLKFDGFVTTSIAYGASATDVQTALRALPNIGSGGCSVSGSAGGPWTVTFTGDLVKLALSTMSLDTNALTGGSGPTVTIAKGATGVTATGRGHPAGTEYVDTDSGERYTNEGTALAPSWSAQGTVVGLTASAAELNIMDGATVTVDEINQLDGNPVDAEMAVPAEQANVVTVSIQLEDGTDADLAARGAVFAYLSDDSHGDSIVATAPSGGWAIGTDGLLIPMVAGKAAWLVSESDGDIDVAITEAGTKTCYLVIVLPNGKLVVSGAITFAA
jgi:hypothetical protein